MWGVVVSDTLQSAVFDRIVQRLQSRREDLFTLTGCTGSFEEWLNWEAYIACKAVPEWCCIAKPKYGGTDGFDVTHPEYKNCLGDIAVKRNEPGGGERWVFAEMALLHDGNRNGKWRDKIACDIEKLRSVPFVNDIRLMVVIASSHRVITSDTAWETYLRGVQIWGSPTPFCQTVQLQPHGSLVARAFQVS